MKQNQLVGFNIRSQSNINLSLLPLGVRKTMAFLDAQNDKDLWPMRDLMADMKVNESTFNNYSAHPSLSDYKAKIGSSLLWGSKTAIKKLRKTLGK